MADVVQFPLAAAKNLKRGYCHRTVHAAKAAMLSGKLNPFGFSSRSRLFPPGSYPVFENGKGARYLREYAPLHLPQVEHGLSAAYQALIKSGRCPRRILDVGSGPGTVPLALRNVIHRDGIQGNWRVDSIEPSSEFCAMLKTSRSALGSHPIYLNQPMQMGIQEYLDLRKPCATDWIVMANVLSALVQGQSPEFTCRLINRLFEYQKTVGAAPALTLIEGSCDTYIDPYVHFRALAANFRVICRQGLIRSVQLPSPHILNCRYYGHLGGPRGCSPRLIMLTITPHKDSR